MGKMNRMRVYLGGLVAGIVIFFADYGLHGLMLKNDWTAAMASLGKPQTSQSMASSMGLFFLQALIAGIASAWVYAAIRPRFGPGPGTALRSALWVWVMISLSPSLIHAALDIFPGRLVIVPLIGDLVILIIAGQVAGVIYKEPA